MIVKWTLILVMHNWIFSWNHRFKFNKNTIKDIVKEKGSELKHTKNLLEIADSSLKEK